MLLWISFVVLIVGVIWVVAYHNSDKYNTFSDFMSGIIMTLGIFAVVISLTICCMQYVPINGEVLSMEREYESLIYQYESDLYENYIDNGKRELMVDIQEWNENLAWYKANQRSFWIGPYIPNVYDQFEFIELR